MVVNLNEKKFYPEGGLKSASFTEGMLSETEKIPVSSR
jgi:hypothetical protein